MCRLQSLTILLPLALLAGCAAPESSDAEDPAEASDAIKAGSAASTHRQTVGHLFITRKTADGDMQLHSCTATLLAPNVVLTANACGTFYSWSWGASTQSHDASFFLEDVESRAVVIDAKTLMDPKYPDDPAQALLLMKLDRSVRSATPAKLAAAAPSKGANVTIEGFGCDSSLCTELKSRDLTWAPTFGTSVGEADDIGAPLFDQSGALVGVVGRFRDPAPALVLGRDLVVPIVSYKGSNDFRAAVQSTLNAWR